MRRHERARLGRAAAHVACSPLASVGAADRPAARDRRDDRLRRRIGRPVSRSEPVAHGMHATFFLNSAVIGDADHLSWSQVHSLADAGNEIAGHTLTHANLKHLKTADARQEVCGDRVNLFDQGFRPPRSPTRSVPSTPAQAVVARAATTADAGVSGVDDTKMFAETIPPLDAYGTRTPPNPKRVRPSRRSKAM